jgi:hypothetical protein
MNQIGVMPDLDSSYGCDTRVIHQIVIGSETKKTFPQTKGRSHIRT